MDLSSHEALIDLVVDGSLRSVRDALLSTSLKETLFDAPSPLVSEKDWDPTARGGGTRRAAGTDAAGVSAPVAAASAATGDCRETIRILRMVKSDDEVEVMRHAAQIVEYASNVVPQEAAVGTGLSGPARAVRGSSRSGGAGCRELHFLSARHGPGEGRRLRPRSGRRAVPRLRIVSLTAIFLFRGSPARSGSCPGHVWTSTMCSATLRTLRFA